MEQYNPECVSVASASLYDCQQVTSLAENLTLYYRAGKKFAHPPSLLMRRYLYFCMASPVTQVMMRNDPAQWSSLYHILNCRPPFSREVWFTDGCAIQVTTVKFRNWLRTLHQFSVAQTVLSSSHPHTSDVIPALCKASAIVYNAMMLTKVCSLIPRPSERVWESD